MANKVNRVAVLGVALLVAVIAAGAWLGKRQTAVSSPDANASVYKETSADTSKQATTPVEPTQKQRSPRPQSRVRSVANGKSPIGGRDALAETAGESSAPVLAPASEADDASEGTVSPAPIPFEVQAEDDDYIYSREGAGIIAPRLMSLGFVHRLVFGLRVRTSTIELVVSKSGTVERAKIFSTPAHWDDALLLSRAKTFKFVPAYRNGSPVRYRLVMDVEASP